MSAETSISDATHYKAMQATVDIVASSQHPRNKIAATLFGTDLSGKSFSISDVNHWPDVIRNKIGTEKKIGNASGTIHAETSCILRAPVTEGASLCITDPFCPNCAKNIAEAGIKTIYIDHKGFDKDFFKRRGNQFDTMSMQICEKAGISVYELWREEKKIIPILEISRGYKPPEDSPVHIEPVESFSEGVFKSIVADTTEKNRRRKFSVAFAEDNSGNKYALCARAHAAVGYSLEGTDIDEALDVLSPIGKYSFIQEPMNRMLMFLSRKGLHLAEGYLYCSQVPTSREQVNLVGANVSRISIGDLQKCRDTYGLKAMEQLKSAGILIFN